MSIKEKINLRLSQYSEEELAVVLDFLDDFEKSNEDDYTNEEILELVRESYEYSRANPDSLITFDEGYMEKSRGELHEKIRSKNELRSR